MNNKENIIWIASFDLGKLNFAFYIEEIQLQDFSSMKLISENKKYNINGTPTLDFSHILEKVYSNGKNILLKNINLTNGVDSKKYFDLEYCYNMSDVLDEYSEYWDKVDFIIIEQQMSFGKKTNTMALKLAQHCASYFINKYGRCAKKIIEFPSYHKTHTLGAEKITKTTKNGKITYKNIDAKERKKWAVEQAFYILSLRDDFETMSEISLMKKKDDVSDVIIQLQAYKCLYLYNK